MAGKRLKAGLTILLRRIRKYFVLVLVMTTLREALRKSKVLEEDSKELSEQKLPFVDVEAVATEKHTIPKSVHRVVECEFEEGTKAKRKLGKGKHCKFVDVAAAVAEEGDKWLSDEDDSEEEKDELSDVEEQDDSDDQSSDDEDVLVELVVENLDGLKQDGWSLGRK